MPPKQKRTGSGNGLSFDAERELRPFSQCHSALSELQISNSLTYSSLIMQKIFTVVTLQFCYAKIIHLAHDIRINWAALYSGNISNCCREINALIKKL